MKVLRTSLSVWLHFPPFLGKTYIFETLYFCIETDVQSTFSNISMMKGVFIHNVVLLEIGNLLKMDLRN